MLKPLITALLLVIANTALADTCRLENAVCTRTGSVTVNGVTLENVCLSYKRIETCTRDNVVSECRALEAEAIETEPLQSGQCRMTSETCTREVSGVCDQVERTYSCLDGPDNAAPAVLEDRRYTNFDERLTSNCAEVIGESCTFFSSQLVQGGSTRNINGKNVTRSWWERTHRYNCDDSGYLDSCSPYEDNPVCRQSAEPVCQSFNDDGSCSYANYTYTCESDTSFTAKCDSDAICADGGCDGAPEEENTDYAEASAWLNFLDDMADKNQCDGDTTTPAEKDGVVVEDCQENRLEEGNTTPEVFSGEYLSCRRGNTNCCDLDGKGSCSAEEERLAARRLAEAAHYLGMRCNRFLGICVSVDEYWCAYASKFARVFQEEAHDQTGAQLNYPGSPHCPALTIDQLQALDISQMNLSEIYGDLLSQTDTLVEDFIITQLENELGMFESNVQDTLQ
ncbi:MAG: conjugal transfer protein TraN [Paracoccaceae bacterium]|nr:conjugal transfer protein TraN [Paracoccaceae bacterium]MDG1736556.1 conjugal transfer protein TraN [Paracoccaceae bacterium]MDG2260637.1 conjugal transfer protein TraN [Paracoccaceae bacterium]